MLKFYRFAAITKRIFEPIPENSQLTTFRTKKMENTFEDHHHHHNLQNRGSFSRTPRKTTRNNNATATTEAATFRTRTQSIASNGSQENGVGGAKQNTSLYKTELCRSFEDTGMCRYGKKCQFAHSKKELRVLARHPKYKTDMCKSYHSTGFCPYGTRCHFIHDADDSSKDSSEECESIVEKVSRVTLSDSIDWPAKPVKPVKPSLTKTKTIASLNSMGSEKASSSVPSIPSVESIWSNANSSTNLNSFDLGLSSVWNDNFLTPMDPVDQRSPPTQQQSQLSLGALDANVWDGLTFASSITNSDRDSLSPDHPPQGAYKTHSDIDIPNSDELFDDPSRLSVFRTLTSCDK